MRKDTVLYEERSETKDFETGEIRTETNKKIIKKQHTPEFVMLFVGGVDKLTNANLSKGEHKTLSQLLKYTIKNRNMLLINKKTKEMMANDSKLKFNTVDQSIRKLITKNMILKEDSMYYLNPDIFGKGDFNEVSKLRHTLQIDYDFNTLTAETEMKTSVSYQNTDELVVVDAKEVIDGKRIEQTIITEPKPKELKTVDDLFNAPIFNISDKNINEVSQNSDIRDLSYKDIKWNIF